jgi:hypothetical protein
MGTLQNVKWEAFARAIAEGRTGKDAYQLAGYRRHRSNSSKLRKREEIRQRIAELQAPAAAACQVTLEQLILATQDIQVRARKANWLRVELECVQTLAKLAGLKPSVEKPAAAQHSQLVDRPGHESIEEWQARVRARTPLEEARDHPILRLPRP